MNSRINSSLSLGTFLITRVCFEGKLLSFIGIPVCVILEFRRWFGKLPFFFTNIITSGILSRTIWRKTWFPFPIDNGHNGIVSIQPQDARVNAAVTAIKLGSTVCRRPTVLPTLQQRQTERMYIVFHCNIEILRNRIKIKQLQSHAFLLSFLPSRTLSFAVSI